MNWFKKQERKPFVSLNRVNISIGRKINVGNFESIDVHASLSRDTLLGESSKDVAQALTFECLDDLNDQLVILKQGHRMIEYPKPAQTKIVIDAPGANLTAETTTMGTRRA